MDKLDSLSSCLYSNQHTFVIRKFDGWLKSRDPAWGVRDLEGVVEAALKEGLVLKKKIKMPANNLSLLFERKKTSEQVNEQSNEIDCSVAVLLETHSTIRREDVT